MGHKQAPVLLKTDNSTAEAFSNSTLKEKRSKPWDMRYWWIQDKVKLKEFQVQWESGKDNLADYHTKHFPPSYHKEIRPTYILKGYNVQTQSYLRGCVNPPLGFITKDIKSSTTNH